MKPKEIRLEITKEGDEERRLLEACRFFLNMLPNERHPNNPHGFATSYDLAAALDRYFAKVAP